MSDRSEGLQNRPVTSWILLATISAALILGCLPRHASRWDVDFTDAFYEIGGGRSEAELIEIFLGETRIEYATGALERLSAGGYPKLAGRDDLVPVLLRGLRAWDHRYVRQNPEQAREGDFPELAGLHFSAGFLLEVIGTETAARALVEFIKERPAGRTHLYRYLTASIWGRHDEFIHEFLLEAVRSNDREIVLQSVYPLATFSRSADLPLFRSIEERWKGNEWGNSRTNLTSDSFQSARQIIEWEEPDPPKFKLPPADPNECPARRGRDE